MMDTRSDFEKGMEAGRIERTISEHGDHLARINGSIESYTRALSALVKEVQALRGEGDLREERVVTTARVLAEDTARRTRDAAETWTRREKLMSLALTLMGLALALVALFD